MQSIPPSQESNGHARLARSSLKAEAIRRGHLKISGPLPVVEDEDKILRSDPSAAPSTPPDFHHHPLKYTDSLSSHPVDRQGSPNQDSIVVPPTAQDNGSVNSRPISNIHRHTMPVISSTDQFSSNPTRSATQSPSEMPSKKKRKSGFMGVFKRMFSKREKRDGKRGPVQQPKHAYTRSDPGALTSSPKMLSEPIPAPAPSSVVEKPVTVEPVHDMRPITPLRAHLPFPMNVNAPQDFSPPADHVEFDEQPAIRRRRATLPSVVFSSAEISALAAIWSQSGTKVTAADEQAVTTPLADSEIGIALSSPTQARHSHRRSQSAGALRDLARNHAENLPLPTSSRRRSAEIRYWRQSIGNRASSVYSDKPDLMENQEGSLPVNKNHENGEATSLNPPLQDFNFGVLDANGPTTAPITRSERKDARSQASKSSLSNRSGHSEPTRQFPANTSRPQSIVLDEAPKGKRTSRQRSASTVRENFSRPSSIRSASAAAHAAQSQQQQNQQQREQQQTPRHPPPPPPQTTVLSTPSTSTNHYDPLTTPIPTTAIKEPQNSSPPAPQIVPLSPSASPTTTHIHSLYTLLAHERAARKTLEATVHALAADLALLRSSARTQHDAYPTPSPDQGYAARYAQAGVYRGSPAARGYAGEDADIEDEDGEGVFGIGTMRHGPGERGMVVHGTGYDAFEEAEEDGVYHPRDPRRETAISRFSKFEDSEDEATTATTDEAGRSARVSGQSQQSRMSSEAGDGLVMKSVKSNGTPMATMHEWEKEGLQMEHENTSRSTTDFGSPDVWETPREEFSAGMLGFAGDVNEDEEQREREKVRMHSPPLRAAPAVPVGMF